MKVTIEGSGTEFEELAKLIAYGLAHRADRCSRQTLQSRDDVPNRFREEGT